MKSAVSKVVLKFVPIGMGLAALSVAASVFLTDSDRGTLPMRAHRWFADWSWRSSSPAQSTITEKKVRADWDEAFDDSGYATAFRFSKPIADPTSLSQMRDSVVGRGSRGIAYLERKLADLNPSRPGHSVRGG